MIALSYATTLPPLLHAVDAATHSRRRYLLLIRHADAADSCYIDAKAIIRLCRALITPLDYDCCRAMLLR